MTPQAISLGGDFTPQALALGNNHSCALGNARVKCWGSSLFGECGYGDTQNRGRNPSTMGDNLLSVPVVGGASTISAGGGLTCIQRNTGVKCWGWGSYGLGQPALRSLDSIGDQPGEVASLTPVALGTGLQPARVTTSGSHTCAILKGGNIKCWGLNQSGELGIGDVNIRGDELADMGDNLPIVGLP